MLLTATLPGSQWLLHPAPCSCWWSGTSRPLGQACRRPWQQGAALVGGTRHQSTPVCAWVVLGLGWCLGGAGRVLHRWHRPYMQPCMHNHKSTSFTRVSSAQLHPASPSFTRVSSAQLHPASPSFTCVSSAQLHPASPSFTQLHPCVFCPTSNHPPSLTHHHHHHHHCCCRLALHLLAGLFTCRRAVCVRGTRRQRPRQHHLPPALARLRPVVQRALQPVRLGHLKQP